MATDLRREIQNRLKELRQETAALEKALAAIKGVGGRGPGRPRGSVRARPGRPRGSGRAKAAPPPARRRRRGGTRAEQALKAVSANPGARVPDIAKQLGIPPNYVYRVMGELVKEKRVRKSGKGYAAA